ncbi:MAG: YIP1 family protein [Gemmatimonadota bacterium]|jgi:hypothetical protein
MDARQELADRMNPNRTIVDRMIGAARLDIPTYEEVEHDEALTAQAALVVVLAAVARAIGGLDGGSTHVLSGLMTALSMWLVWAGITYLIGDKMLGGTATWGELLRTLGFAQAPGLLAVLGVFGPLSGVTELVVSIWLLVTGIVAIRQALDFGTGKAILTAVLGWLSAIAVAILIALAIGGMAAIFGGIVSMFGG